MSTIDKAKEHIAHKFGIHPDQITCYEEEEVDEMIENYDMYSVINFVVPS